ncbi:ATP-binding cassette domain-containing protein [Treponema socranskii]|uniref:ATP-binding cassette domain-containing protein n=1 Tax=Treponema socranskii TaxID=53419 RepID=UPI003D6E30C4
MDVALEHISKRYLHKTVLDDLSLVFQGGMIHALLGENGAGKSTTAAILSGALEADSGTVLIDGKAVHFSSPRDALRAGIVCVRQRPLIADGISVWENILLGTEYGAAGKKLKKAEIFSHAELLKSKWAPHLNFRALAAHIGGDERFYTALISALIREPRMLILDEPSALLDREQRVSLYANIRELADKGMNIVVITHIMQEASRYTDTVTVLQKGKGAEYYERSALYALKTQSEAVHLHAVRAERSDDCISFEHIGVRPKKRPALFDVSFTAKSGGITLIEGLPESGLGTLENVITGMESARTAGLCRIKTDGRTLRIDFKSGKWTPYFLRTEAKLRTAIIPSDRTFRASNPDLSIEQLLCAMYGGKSADEYTKRLIEKAKVSIRPDEKAASLSGGMLQRLILAREFENDPNLIIACEPLQGLDGKAAERTQELLSDFAMRGAVVIVLSSSEFPSSLCAARYSLEGGALREVREAA